MYAIKNVQTGKYVIATNYREDPVTQIESRLEMLTYANLYTAKHDYLIRKCGPQYKIIEILGWTEGQTIEPPETFDDIKYEERYVWTRPTILKNN